MASTGYMRRLKLDQAELESRRAYFEITDDDLSRLAGLRSLAEQHMEGFIEDLYELILGHVGSRRVFEDQSSVKRAQSAQKEYFLGLFSGRLDLEYVEDRLRIGATHEKHGVDPKFYLGAYSRYLRLLNDRLSAELDPAEANAAYESMQKVVAFDMALAMDTYIAAQNDAIERQQAAIRELSTPVIRIHDRVLLLPLIGTVDTVRSEQVMETVLERVVAEQARVVIIDVAGVPVVDTGVASHLLRTTEAARLLGAATVLSGVSPTVAKTVVKLGIDISSMRTTSRLADGLQLALRIAADPFGDHKDATGEGQGA